MDKSTSKRYKTYGGFLIGIFNKPFVMTYSTKVKG